MTIKTYSVTVRGFENASIKIWARTPSEARAQAWRSYLSFDDGCSFTKFVTMSTIKRIENPPGVDDRILVGG
jgi:hypothetical protein